MCVCVCACVFWRMSFVSTCGYVCIWYIGMPDQSFCSRGIKFTQRPIATWCAGPFVMTSSIKCFSHRRATYAVCSESIICFCVITTATNYSYRDHQALHTQPRAWGKQHFSSIHPSNSPFSLGKLHLHTIKLERSQTRQSENEMPPGMTKTMVYSS